jgi:Domain of unknown function (DUF4439)
MTRADERLAAALVAEHAAIFGYGLAGARLDAANVALAAAAETAHRSRRDAIVMRLTGRGANAPVAETAYALPAPVTDQASALRLAIMIEERTAATWRAALLDTTAEDRRMAVDALVDCAIRAVRLRRAAGANPATVPFPGRLEGT